MKLLLVTLCLASQMLPSVLAIIGGCSIDNPPETGKNTYKVFTYDAGPPCTITGEVCEATLATALAERTWFIDNIRKDNGLGYPQNIIQDYRVQCPPFHVLHLYLQSIDLDGVVGTCASTDNIRLSASGISATDEIVFCGTNPSAVSELYNDGHGRIIVDGAANITFCTDNFESDDPMNRPLRDGFVIRATCLRPDRFILPNCADLAFFQRWDPQFTNAINNITRPAVPRVPHKRKRSIYNRFASQSIDTKVEHNSKVKRGAKFDQIQEIGVGDKVSYVDSQIIVTFADINIPEVKISNVFLLWAYSELIGTRDFFFDTNFVFYGPGELRYSKFGTSADLRYTVDDTRLEEFLLPGILEILDANKLYTYLYEHWVRPYPVIESPVNPLVFPLNDGNNPPDFSDLDPKFPGYRPSNSVPFLQETITQTSTCRRAITIRNAPALTERIVPRELYNYCSLFIFSCDLALRTACLEVARYI